MNIEESMMQFVNEQKLEYPLLTDWDVFNLKLGYARGCQDAIKHETAQTIKLLGGIHV
mgnify:CR=1 FL=1